MLGRVVPNYINHFPNTHLQQGLELSLGTFSDTNSTWAKYYNFPEAGICLFYSSIGNNKIFGQQFNAMPFITYQFFNKLKNPYYLKLGLGVSYFTTFYDSITNPINVNVGSSFTWGFQAFAYKIIYKKEGMNIKLGAGFSHASNGHTQLPNLGLNSGLISIEAQFYGKEHTVNNFIANKEKVKSKSYSIGLRRSIGFHEYGNEYGPVGKGKRRVLCSTIYVGRTTNNFLNLKSGITYRFYEQYYHQIIDRQLEEYIANPKHSASNVVVFVGAELLMNHISMDLELGGNIYKPFYKQYNEDFHVGTTFQSFQVLTAKFKNYISTRLGLNLYLINTNKLSRHNLFVGAHIKANFGQADYSELTLGYQYKLK